MTVPRPLPSLLLAPIRAVRDRYGRVLAVPGAVGFVLPAAVARLGVAMTGLGLLLTLERATGSYAVAGAATGAFAAAEAVAGPQIARLVDRLGQAATLPIVVAVHAAAIAAALLTAGRAPLAVTLLLVATAGAAVPQPGALSAARWAHLVTTPGPLRSAFALEAGINDAAFLCGPVLVTLIGTAVAPGAGSAVAAALLVGGCVALACRRGTAPPPRRRTRPAAGGPATTLLAPRFLATLGVHAGLGCFFGAVPLLVAAGARAAGLEPLTGVLLALSSAASILVGLVYGALRRAPTPEVVQLVAAAALTAAVSVGVLWPSLPGLATMLVVGGTAIAPLLASSSQVVEACVAPGELTQGFTWINTASAAGIAASAALTGALISSVGTRAAVAVLLGLVLVGTASAAVAVRAARPAARTDPTGRPIPPRDRS
jgi:hypothetical protein